jgi:hypothetical protein
LIILFHLSIYSNDHKMIEVGVVDHDLNPYQVGFEQVEVLPEKRLEIFILALAEKGMVWG